MDRKEQIEKARELLACGALSQEACDAIKRDFPELQESNDEKHRKWILEYLHDGLRKADEQFKDHFKTAIAWLDKQKEASKAIEAVDRIDKYIDVHLANAHDMKDSNPDKKYYLGLDDALGKIAGILQDVYSEKQKEQRPIISVGQSLCISQGEYRNIVDECIYGEQKEQNRAERTINKWAGSKRGLPPGTRTMFPIKGDDDEKLLGFMRDHFWNLVKLQDENERMYTRCLVYLDKLNEQKPAERLEAEEGKWYICIKDFYAGGKKCASTGDLIQAKGGMYMMGREDISGWFRKAYYDEIKPAGWSEEEVDAMVKAFSDNLPLCGEFQTYHDALVHTYRQGVLAALKAIRPQPQWKPTEEQMDTLKKVVFSRPVGEDGINILEELYDDLEKL